MPRKGEHVRPAGSGWPKMPTRDGEQQCRNCLAWKPLVEFRAKARLPLKHVSTCLACERCHGRDLWRLKKDREARQLATVRSGGRP